MSPDVSVVMSVYNGAKFLREAIDSILLQSFQNFELLIVDDGSTDETSAILEDYRSIDDRIQVIVQRNMGLTYSLNRGVQSACAPLVARMDADDVAASERLRWQVKYMKEHPDVDLLGGSYDLIDTKGARICSALLPLTDADLREALMDSATLLHPSVMMRKSAFEAVGGYRDVQYTEDYDLWLRLSERGKIANLPQLLVKYRVHPNQVSVSRCREQALWTCAVQAAAAMRQRGEQDPLDSTHTIAPPQLDKMGVSKQVQQTALARAYLRYMRNMFHIGEYEMALQAFRVIGSGECELAGRWIRADALLWAAKIHFKGGSLIRYIWCVWQACCLRPLVLGRPLKIVLRTLTSLAGRCAPSGRTELVSEANRRTNESQ